MGATARDVVQGLGDALAGVDRNQQFLKGEQIGAEVDEKRAQTEAAMTLARQRRIEAEVAEAQKERDAQIAAMDTATLTDPNKAPLGTLIASKHGADYSGVMEGRNRAQQYEQRQTVATPAGLGDVTAEAAREAAMDALSPAAAIASRRPRASGAPQVVQDPDNPDQTILIPPQGGEPVQVTTPSGPHTARPQPRPTGDPTQIRVIDGLVRMGVDRNDAINLVTGAKANPESLYNAVIAAQLRNFVDPDTAAHVAKNAVAARFGADAAERAGGQQLVPDKDTAQLPRGVPKGSQLIGHTKEGHEVYQLPDGSKVVSEQ